MIYTVTFNPSLDYIMSAERFEKGSVNRSEKEVFRAGGKGLNVSFVLKELGVPSVALGFSAGFIGNAIARMAQDAGIHTDFLRVKGVSRVNVKIRAEEETDVNGNGPEISENALRKLAQKLRVAPAGAAVVLAGSVPRSLSGDAYLRFLSYTGRSDLRIVLDASGELFKRTLAAVPWLVKPNREELEQLFGARIGGVGDGFRLARELRKMGAHNVIVSLGEEGALLTAENGNEIFAPAPKGTAVDTVGAGDSLLAGFLAAKEKGLSDSSALALGVAAGSATAFRVGLASGGEIESLYARIAEGRG